MPRCWDSIAQLFVILWPRSTLESSHNLNCLQMPVVIPVESSPSEGEKVRNFVGKTVLQSNCLSAAGGFFYYTRQVYRKLMVPAAFQGKLVFLHNL